MSLITSWVLFPLVLAAVGAGWGVVVQRLAGSRVPGALIVPLGLAAAIVLASLLTAWSATAPAAIAIVAVVAAGGLALGWSERGRLRGALWPGVAAAGVLLAYGAPILLSGEATFAGYVRLDDTATWLGIVDQAMGHGRDLSYLPSSTYSLVLNAYVGNSYPLGGFMLLGVGHGLTGIDSAWVFQPYLACCGAAVGLSIYALSEPLVASPRLRALVAFLAAQPALLYGYGLWGGIKELTAAFLLVLGAALLARAARERPAKPRELLPLGIAAAALIDTLGAGAAAWVLPALAGLVGAWAWRARRAQGAWGAQLKRTTKDLGLLSIVTAVLALPMWVVLSSFLETDSNLYSGQSTTENLGNLIQPLSGWQLAGAWPVGDFRLRGPAPATGILVGIVLVASCLALWLSLRRGQLGLLAYVGLALSGCAVFWLADSTPWVIGKALAISSPALLAAALVGGALLLRPPTDGGTRLGAPPGNTGPDQAASGRPDSLGWRSPLGAVVLIVVGGGVLWSNVLAYHDVLLAPKPRLAELQHIGKLLAGQGPTFVNEYEVYADRHFLREGAPVEPAEYRSVDLPLRDGTILTKSAWADLDSFALSTFEPYRSLVIARSPAESRPPSTYRLVWRGRYYELWQRPAKPTRRVLEHVPLGESNALPYCGAAENGPASPLCSADPTAVPACPEVESLARSASREGARLLAYQRPEPVLAHGDQLIWPAGWRHDPASRTLWPNAPGTAVAKIAVHGDQTYELWLGGSFSRGFEVSVDGSHVGDVKNELRSIGGYAPVAQVYLGPGVHTVALTYPQ
ncbi:MAG TPA: hypothetical protein VMG80_01940, partial [Solirubrobacteraceae bacterium]|nr:hypothetical protein [Solirubrobacteraceae bacterium]